MKAIIGLILVQLIAGCSSHPSQSDAQDESFISATANSVKSLFQTSKNSAAQTQVQAPESQQSIHFYAERLAKQFFVTSENININKTIAVGTFLPIEHLSGNTLPQADAVAHQLQESFVTIATQVGLSVIEFKAMSNIKIKNNQDIMLSRQADELSLAVAADYYLTGTYTHQHNSLVVNVRLIELPTRKVIAAATDHIPTNVMKSQSTVTMKNNQLYRGVN
ncbi:MAG: FlgO family outer membrane protein [Thalassotalea sp.]